MSDDNTNLTAQDEVDLALLEAVGEPLGRTVLEIWQSVLSNIDTMEEERIEPGYANHLLQKWPKLTIHTIKPFYHLFHDYLRDYRDIVEEQIRLHPDALKKIKDLGDPDSDAIANREIYGEIMFLWNLTTARQEAEWDIDTEFAYEALAAINEAQLFVTGGQGMMQSLVQPQVGFVWTDEDQTALQERVVAAVEEL